MSRARRREGGSTPRASGHVGEKHSGGGRGHVHPNAPTSIHNSHLMIEPRTVNKVRQADYVRKYGALK